MTIPDYIHRVHPRAKRISLKLSETGQLVVVSPKFTPQWLIKQCIHNNYEWVISHQQKLRQARETILPSSDQLLLFGKQYQLHLRYLPKQPAGIFTEENHLIINPYDPNAASVIACRPQLTRFLKKSARRYIEPRATLFSKNMQATFTQVQFREQKSRWGSCSHQGTLSFNWRLVHCPTAVIDYVIIHELAHLIHFDHSKAFWNVVARHDPAFQQHRGWLKRHGQSILGLKYLGEHADIEKS